uniref:ATP synthase subunit 8 n=1 Tax=Haemaphysalis humerosa TaxID=65643 RepID=L7PCL0_9ACAR|nr:ATP synthase subunit 8 [Haemaphysalis humerosa]
MPQIFPLNWMMITILMLILMMMIMITTFFMKSFVFLNLKNNNKSTNHLMYKW